MASPKFCTQCAGPLEVRRLEDERWHASIRSGTPSPASDVSDVAWFPLDRLPDLIAFTNNRQALNTLKANRSR